METKSRFLIETKFDIEFYFLSAVKKLSVHYVLFQIILKLLSYEFRILFWKLVIELYLSFENYIWKCWFSN